MIRKKIGLVAALSTYILGGMASLALGYHLTQGFIDGVRMVKPLYHREIPVTLENGPTPVEWLDAQPQPAVENILPAYELHGVKKHTGKVKKSRVNTQGGVPIFSVRNLSGNLSPNSFRDRLEQFYENGYVLVSMSDVVQNQLDAVVPRGRKPMVLSFSNATPTQFSLQEENGEYYVNPSSALGILERFSKSRPDFGKKGLFVVDFDNIPFGHKESLEEKIDYLVESGFEFGTQSLSGRLFAHLDKEEIVKELAESSELIEDLVGEKPLYAVVPGGNLPKGVSFEELRSFSYEGEEYSFVFLRTTNSLTPSPKTSSFRDTPYLKRWSLNTSLEDFSTFISQVNNVYVSSGKGKAQPVIPQDRIRKIIASENAQARYLYDYNETVDVTPFSVVNLADTELSVYGAEARVEAFLLQRAIPVIETIESVAARYKLGTSWILQTYALESEFNPVSTNKRTDDWGIGQMKKANFRMGVALAQSDTAFKTVLADAIVEGNIYNPEHSIVASGARGRYLIEKFDLTRQAQLTAIYHGGSSAIGPNGWYAPQEQRYIDAHTDNASRVHALANVFAWPSGHLDKIYNPIIRDSLEVYHKYSSPQERYSALLDINIEFLKNNDVDSWGEAVLFTNAIVFSKTLELGYGQDQTAVTQFLENEAEKILALNKGKSLYSYLETAVDRLHADYSW